MRDRVRHSLDNQGLCFLSVFYNEQKEIEKICFDVEAADDYHYEIDADQLPKLCEFIRCQNTVPDIVVAFKGQLRTWKDPIEIAELCKKAGIKYQPFHFY